MKFKRIDVVILAGGKGSRIKKYLNLLPKPMMPINGRNFLSYLIQRLCIYNVRKIYILCGYRADLIIKKYHNKIINFVPIVCVKEKKPMGTGGCLHKIFKKVSKEFILINGDTFIDVDYSIIINKKINENQSAMVVKKINKDLKSEKLNKLNVKNSYISIAKKGKYFNAGTYKLNKKIIKIIPKKFCSLENEIIKNQIENKQVIPIMHKGFFLDIGSPESLRKSHNLLSKKLKKYAVFLDRDGTINEDYQYVYKKKDFHFKKGVIQGLQYLTKKNYYLFIVTNQAGIAKNKFTLEDLTRLHTWLKQYFLNKKIIIHDVEYCPFHKNAKNIKYKKNSLLRKPGNLMIENLKKKWDINLTKSFFIGDKYTDELAARKSSLKFFYANTNFYKQIKDLVN
jgi:D,D-heptose 1,7-bisphosphate phosphatase